MQFRSKNQHIHAAMKRGRRLRGELERLGQRIQGWCEQDRVQADMRKCQAQLNTWYQAAERALRAGREDLARLALREKALVKKFQTILRKHPSPQVLKCRLDQLRDKMHLQASNDVDALLARCEAELVDSERSASVWRQKL